MNQNDTLPADSQARILDWAARRFEPVSVSVRRGAAWLVLRANFAGLDEPNGRMEVTYPVAGPDAPAAEIETGEEVGISFRRGHKKCVFSTTVAGRRNNEEGLPILVLALPTGVREFQRRAYQREIVPNGWVIQVRLSARSADGNESFICAGQLKNISAGGLQFDLPAAEHPRLAIGASVCAEIRLSRSNEPLRIDGVYRHATAGSDGRIGLGVQFVGLEATAGGRQTLHALADFVSELRRPRSRRPYQPRPSRDAGPHAARPPID